MLRGFLSKLAAAICRWPWVFVVTGIAIAAAAAVYTARSLEFNTNRNDLIGRNSEYWRLYSEYAREFSDEEDYVIVVEGDQPAQNKAAVDALVKALLAPENNPSPADSPTAQQFNADDVFYRVDFDALQNHFLYFLDVKDLNEINASLKDFKQLVAVLQQKPELATFFDAMNQMLQQMETAPEADRRRMEAFLPTIIAIVNQMADPRSGKDEAGLLSPWASAFFSEEMLGQAEDQMRWKGYNVFAKGKMFLMLIHPRASESAQGTALDKATVPKLRRILASVRGQFPAVKIGLTGEPVLDLDEMQTSQHDATKATVLTLILVGLLFAFSFRTVLRPALAVICVIFVVALSMGWATLAVGHLNIITVTFAVMIIGLGIDLGIQLIARYEEELSKGADALHAVATAIEQTGASIITAAITNAAAFFAMGLSGFRGVIELGVIAGGGMILAMAVMVLVLPALMLLVRSKKESSIIPAQATATKIERVLLRHPYAVLAICGMATVAALLVGWRVDFDYNLLNLQSRSLQSVEIEKRLLKADAQTTIFAAVVCDSFEQARKLQELLEKKTNTVNSVASIVPLIPEHQEEKATIIRAIQGELGDVHIAATPVSSLDPEPVIHALRSLRLQTRKLVLDAAERNDAISLKALGALTNSLTRASVKLSAEDATALGARLAKYQQRFYGDLQAQLQMMVDQVVDRPMTLNDVPREVRRMLIGKSGKKFLLRVFPSENIWDREPLERFVRDVRSIAPQATGTPLGIYEFVDILQRGYIKAAFWAFLVIAVLIFANFRGLMATALTLLPLIVGMIWMVGAMALFRIPFNPANIMVLPLLVGIGVAYGIYVVQRYREDGEASFYSKSTGRAVVLSSLTTIVGFGSLMIGKHRGIFTLGLVMTIGVTACLVAALALLPALLEIARRKGWKV